MSSLELHLGHEDRKRLHEFEKKCVEVYFHEKNKDLQNNQIKKIRAIAERFDDISFIFVLIDPILTLVSLSEFLLALICLLAKVQKREILIINISNMFFYSTRAEEMSVMVGEISDKVNFIQHSLSELDCQMGQLQDLSALAVDTLTLLSASDSLQKEEARLAQCRVNPTLQHVLPHSWTLPHRSNADCDVPNFRRLVTKSCKSTPPSLLKGSVVAASRMTSLERHMGSKGSKEEKHKDTEREEETKEVTSGS